MTAKEYLNQAYGIDRQINAKLDQIESLRAIAIKATATWSDMPKGTGNVRSREGVYAKLADLEAEINSDIDKLIDLKKEIGAAIKAVPDPLCRTLLEKRYLCFKPWEEIAYELNYGLRQIYRLHEKALSLFNPPKDVTQCH